MLLDEVTWLARNRLGGRAVVVLSRKGSVVTAETRGLRVPAFAAEALSIRVALIGLRLQILGGT